MSDINLSALIEVIDPSRNESSSSVASKIVLAMPE